MQEECYNMIQCSICNQEFNELDNPLIEIQKQRHVQWHTNCTIEGRNTVEGKIEWIIK